MVPASRFAHELFVFKFNERFRVPRCGEPAPSKRPLRQGKEIIALHRQIWVVLVGQQLRAFFSVKRYIDKRPVPLEFPGFRIGQRVKFRCQRILVGSLQQSDLVVVSGTVAVEQALNVGQVVDVHEDVDVIIPRQHIVHDVRPEQRAVRQHVRDVELGKYGVDLRQQLDAAVMFLSRNKSRNQLMR